MPQVARVGAAHRQQDVEVGDAEVRVVGGGAADPGPEPEVAAQQRGEVRAARGGGELSGVQSRCGVTRYSSGARCLARTACQVVAAWAPPSDSDTLQQPASQV